MIKEIILITSITSLAHCTHGDTNNRRPLTRDATAALIVASFALVFAVLIFCRICHAKKRESEQLSVTESPYPEQCLPKYETNSGFPCHCGEMSPPPPYHLAAEPHGSAVQGSDVVVLGERLSISVPQYRDTDHMTDITSPAPEYSGGAASDETLCQGDPPSYETLDISGNRTIHSNHMVRTV